MIKVTKPQYETEEEDFAFSDGLRAGVQAAVLNVNKLINPNNVSKNYIEISELKSCLENMWKKDAPEAKGEVKG